MINFKKRLEGLKKDVKSNPIEIYDTLDRASDKGPLRPSQYAILTEWYEKRKEVRDNIIKLHTGQGKTLIGLLILQSRINSNLGPAIYICPNIFLSDQTKKQAQQFGIPFCTTDKELPQEFLNGEKILITHAQKVFNGFTKFGLKTKAIDIDSIVLDDSHSCIETIEESFTIKITLKDDQDLYSEIFSILEEKLEDQGYAKLQEIKDGNTDEVISVPYWNWKDNYKKVINILSANKENHQYKFAWDLIKDKLDECYCFISGELIEIRPYNNPIEKYASFHNANCRIFMSATTNNDSFFIKGLGLKKDTILNPIISTNNLWSGEKMILLPYNINENLSRENIIKYFAPKDNDKKMGHIVLTTGFYRTNIWEQNGATVIKSENIKEKVDSLLDGNYSETLVFANRYDGIDLPDNSCRLLIIDSKPYSETLHDKYQEEVRLDSDVIDVKIAQKIEQGLGRGVRGEKDYCVILLIGADILNVAVNERYRKFFSEQTHEQVKLGLEITKYAVDDAETSDPLVVLVETINQCLKRNEDWKEFYKQRMDSIKPKSKDESILNILEIEKAAEDYFSIGDPELAHREINKIIDMYVDKTNFTEIGWYNQQIARYLYSTNSVESNNYQIIAHKNNRYLYKPFSGMDFKKLIINQDRSEKIKAWINQFASHAELKIKLEFVLGNLSFNSTSELFEQSLEQIGKCLGFESERPEKYWKEGPDNLWCIDTNNYILFECKNEVALNRAEIFKKDTGQMGNSCNWFEKNYPKSSVTPIMIINTKKCASDASFDKRVLIMRKKKLNELYSNIKKFYNEFNNYELRNITSTQITQLLSNYNLNIENFNDLTYTEKYI